MPISFSTTSVGLGISTRDRLLDAATSVFARVGLKAATTREIAHVAGVNEVTLFRLFKSKKNLLASVLERTFSLPEGVPPDPADCRDRHSCLTTIVTEYTNGYSARIGKNLPLLRVLIGEIQHFEEHELSVMRGIFRPDRQKLIDRLQQAKDAGCIRADADPIVVADQLSALVFMGALRSALPQVQDYSNQHYLRHSIETIVRGIEIPSPTGSPSSATRQEPNL